MVEGWVVDIIFTQDKYNFMQTTDVFRLMWSCLRTGHWRLTFSAKLPIPCLRTRDRDWAQVAGAATTATLGIRRPDQETRTGQELTSDGGGQGRHQERVVSFHLIRLHIVQSADQALCNCKRSPGDTNLWSSLSRVQQFLYISKSLWNRSTLFVWQKITLITAYQF